MRLTKSSVTKSVFKSTWSAKNKEPGAHNLSSSNHSSSLNSEDIISKDNERIKTLEFFLAPVSLILRQAESSFVFLFRIFKRKQ